MRSNRLFEMTESPPLRNSASRQPATCIVYENYESTHHAETAPRTINGLSEDNRTSFFKIDENCRWELTIDELHFSMDFITALLIRFRLNQYEIAFLQGEKTIPKNVA